MSIVGETEGALSFVKEKTKSIKSFVNQTFKLKPKLSTVTFPNPKDKLHSRSSSKENSNVSSQPMSQPVDWIFQALILLFNYSLLRKSMTTSIGPGEQEELVKREFA